MKTSRIIRGIVPVVSTPFDEYGDIDIPALERLINFLKTKRIGGMWVLGTGSEDMNLTFEKRLQVAQKVTEVNDGKIPLVLGTGFFALEDILSFAKEVQDLQFDAYHVMPYHPLLSLDRLDWFYRHIADNLSKPLWMYTSANWSRAITPQFVFNLKAHPNIAGIKFSTKDAVALTEVASFSDDGFQVITAVASQLYTCLCIGSKAHTSSLGSCLPDMLIQIYDHFVENDYEASLEKQLELNKFLSAISTGAKKDNFLMAAEEKFILSLMGICKTYTSPYYRDLTEDEQLQIVAALKNFNIMKVE